MAADMECQRGLKLPPLSLPEPSQSEPLGSRMAFAGSGDSYAAALAAHYLSSGRATCHRPADIIDAGPLLAGGRVLYIVSISGRTKANALAAKAAQTAGMQTVAVTADESSPLARRCSRIIRLDYPASGTRTSGTVSFTASLVACAWLATGGRPGLSSAAEIGRIYDDAAAKAAAGKPGAAPAIILGDAHLYPAAIYGALKLNEVLGARAVAYPLEEFFHAPLFGVKGSDRILVLGNSQAAKKLKGAGLGAQSIACPGKTALESLLYAVFFLQHLVLGLAERRGLTDCRFVSDKKLLRLSSDFIY